MVWFKRPFIEKGGKCWRRTLSRENYTEYAQKKSKYWVVNRYVDDYNGVQDEWIGWQNITEMLCTMFSDSLLLRKGGSVGDGPCPAKTISNKLTGT